MLDLQLTIQQAINLAVTKLNGITETPILDAEVLLAFALQKPRSYIHAWPNNNLTNVQTKHFVTHLKRRLSLEPIAYITGYKEFWSLQLAVSADTLVPRPETELLVEKALDMINKDQRDVCIADLGTGCGAIALALAYERPQWQIFATDICHRALQIAKKNANSLELKNICFHQGNWCQALPVKKFDIIISNPPYISEREWHVYAKGLQFEPSNALISGWDGLDAIRTIVQGAKRFLKRQGSLLIEHGSLQGRSVRDTFFAESYCKILTLTDGAGNGRVTLGQIFAEQL